MADTPITIDARGPVVLITYRGGCSDAEYEDYLRRLTDTMNEVGKAHRYFGQVHDARHWTKSTAHQRKLQADWIKERFAWLQQHGGFCGFVFESALVRGGLTAVMWLVKMPGPYKIFGAVEPALAWVQDNVDQAPHRTRRASLF